MGKWFPDGLNDSAPASVEGPSVEEVTSKVITADESKDETKVSTATVFCTRSRGEAVVIQKDVLPVATMKGMTYFVKNRSFMKTLLRLASLGRSAATDSRTAADSTTSGSPKHT